MQSGDAGDWVGLPKGRAMVGETQKPARDTSELGDQPGSFIFCWTSALLLNGGEPEPRVVTTVIEHQHPRLNRVKVKVGTDVLGFLLEIPINCHVLSNFLQLQMAFY